MKKLPLLMAAGVGYVLGTRDGRERYDQIRNAALKVRNDPRVQEKAKQAADVAREQAPVIKDKVTEGAHAAADKVKSTTGPSASSTPSGPQGDLP